jgi:deoxyribonuclease-4
MPAAVDRLRFGTAGVPDTSPQTSTLSALQHLRELGLDCLEIEFVRGVKIGSDTAAKIKEKARALDISLSAHAPYYVNLNSPEIGKRLQSQDHLLRAARAAALCGAHSVVFHAGYYGASMPEKAHEAVKRELGQVLSVLRAERNPVTLRVETMGKASQFGTLDEVLTLCKELDGLQPCLDFSHMHARDGRANSYVDFHRTLRKVEKRLGKAALKRIHIHISGIEYNPKGEVRHLNLPDSDFRYHEWIRALGDFDVAGSVVCESPARESDAPMLRDIYRTLRLKR